MHVAPPIPFMDAVPPVSDKETGVDRVVSEWGGEKTGPRSYRFTTSEARRLAWLLDRIEQVVLP